MHDVTRPVPLTVTVNELDPDRGGGRRTGFSATAHLRRGDFGIDRWTGRGAAIGDAVSVRLEIQAVREQTP